MSERTGHIGGLWVPAFDGIRGLVSCAIALTHVTLAVGWYPNHDPLRSLRGSMFFSIEFLFLIGGFVAFLPIVYYGRFSGTRSYAIRRLGRLLPLYWLTIALAILLGPALREVTGANSPHDLTAVLVHMGFLQQIVYPFAGGFGVQGIIWTMTIAACFYVAFPFIVGAFQRYPLAGLAVAIAISVTWRLATKGDPHSFLQFPLFAVDFGIGMAAAVAYVRLEGKGRPRLNPRAALAGFALAFAVLIAGLYASGHDIVETRAYWNEGVLLSVLVPTSFAALLVCLPFTPGWVQWPLANPVARFIGSINYGLFLSHFLVIWGVLYLTDIPRNSSPQSVIKLTLLVMPLSILFGWLGTKFVEHPIRTRAQQLAAGRRAPAPHSPGAPAAAPAPATAPAPD